MNLMKILDALSVSDKNSEEYHNLATRREAFGKMSNFSKNLALAAVPTAVLSAFPKIAFGQSNSVIDTLNFALTLEFLESEYYNMGLANADIPASDRAVFEQIAKHENAHVAYLQDAIDANGGTPVSKPNFDFTAGGAFNDPFSQGEYNTFLALSQGFEDTGVRAYKGQAGNLKPAPEVLQVALQIHSVEARHASEVRRLRNLRGFDNTNKGWITGKSIGTMPPATQGIYDGEENLTQGGVDVTTLGFDSGAVSEAFDEPLAKMTVEGIAGLFIV